MTDTAKKSQSSAKKAKRPQTATNASDVPADIAGVATNIEK